LAKPALRVPPVLPARTVAKVSKVLRDPRVLLVPRAIPEKMDMTAFLAPSDRKARLAQLVRLATLVRQVQQVPKGRLGRQAAMERLARPVHKVLRVPPVILVRRAFPAPPVWQAPVV
jgi:hypothetical protein